MHFFIDQRWQTLWKKVDLRNTFGKEGGSYKYKWNMYWKVLACIAVCLNNTEEKLIDKKKNKNMEFETVKTFKPKFSKVQLFNNESEHDMNSGRKNPMVHLLLVIHRPVPSVMLHNTKPRNTTKSHHYSHYWGWKLLGGEEKVCEPLILFCQSLNQNKIIYNFIIIICLSLLVLNISNNKICKCNSYSTVIVDFYHYRFDMALRDMV